MKINYKTKNYEFACKIVDILVTFASLALFHNSGVVKQVVLLLWSSPENFQVKNFHLADLIPNTLYCSQMRRILKGPKT